MKPKPFKAPQFPEGRLPESAKVEFYKNGRLKRRTMKCGVCARRRPFGGYLIFKKRMPIDVCLRCITAMPWDMEKALEEIIMERFAQNPAYCVPEKGGSNGKEHVVGKIVVPAR